MTNNRTDGRTANQIPCAIDPLFLIGGNELRKNLMPLEHVLEIHIRRPDTMHTMLI
ncbi:hypothetical protein D3C83_331480 [compost metagenome]